MCPSDSALNSVTATQLLELSLCENHSDTPGALCAVLLVMRHPHHHPFSPLPFPQPRPSHHYRRYARLLAKVPVVVLIFCNPMFPNYQAAILQMKIKGVCWAVCWAQVGIGVLSSDSQLTPFSLQSNKAALPTDPFVLRAFELALLHLEHSPKDYTMAATSLSKYHLTHHLLSKAPLQAGSK